MASKLRVAASTSPAVACAVHSALRERARGHDPRAPRRLVPPAPRAASCRTAHALISDVITYGSRATSRVSGRRRASLEGLEGLVELARAADGADERVDGGEVRRDPRLQALPVHGRGRGGHAGGAAREEQRVEARAPPRRERALGHATTPRGRGEQVRQQLERRLGTTWARAGVRVRVGVRVVGGA